MAHEMVQSSQAEKLNRLLSPLKTKRICVI